MSSRLPSELTFIRQPASHSTGTRSPAFLYFCPTYLHLPQHLRYHKRCPSSWQRSHRLCSGFCIPALLLNLALSVTSSLPFNFRLLCSVVSLSSKYELRRGGSERTRGGKMILLPEDQPSILFLPVLYSTLCACPFSSATQLPRPPQLGFCPLDFSGSAKCSSLLSASLLFNSRPC